MIPRVLPIVDCRCEGLPDFTSVTCILHADDNPTPDQPDTPVPFHHTTNDMNLYRKSWMLMFLLTLPVHAQNGPPPHVRESVDAIIEVLSATDTASMVAFIDEKVHPDHRADREAWMRLVTNLRTRTNNARDNVSVELDQIGLRLVLTGPAGERNIRLELSPEGIISMRESDPPPAPSAWSEEGARERHVEFLESGAGEPFDAYFDTLERDHFGSAYRQQTTVDERRALVEKIRNIIRGANSVSLDFRGDETVLGLGGTEQHEVIFTVDPVAPFGIRSLRVVKLEPTGRNDGPGIDGIMDLLDGDGFSGVVHVNVTDQPRVHTALGEGIDLDTVFDIGSIPMAFTRIGILKLATDGLLDLDAPISDWWSNVPPDKASITVRHLLDHTSGLPNFHHTSDDSDRDLTWIDKETAIRRMLGTDLLFAPGQDVSASHSAYGMLAAITEEVTGEPWMAFMEREIFKPAGMKRTGLYGEDLGLNAEAFAVGHGQHASSPNIPPHWGPTSWLIMGSGGMVSTLEDLLALRAHVRAGNVLSPEYAAFLERGLMAGGTDRGFFVFHAFNGDDEALIMSNSGRPDNAVIDGLLSITRARPSS